MHGWRVLLCQGIPRIVKVTHELAMRIESSHNQDRIFFWFNKLLLFSSIYVNVLNDYKNEHWWPILTSIMSNALNCAFLIADITNYCLLCIELIGKSKLIEQFLLLPNRSDLLYNWMVLFRCANFTKRKGLNTSQPVKSNQQWNTAAIFT